VSNDLDANAVDPEGPEAFTELTDTHVLVRDFARGYRIADRAEGIYVWDEAGKRYIDAAGGVSAVVSIGHGVAEIAEVMREQAQKMAYAPMHMFLHRPVIELAREVATLAPAPLNQVWFVSGGSEATENAVKLARQYQLESGYSRKSLVISRWESFHGATLGALGYGGHTARRRLYEPMFVNSPHIPPAFPYRCVYCGDRAGCTLQCAEALEHEVRRQGPENVAAFIAEPVVGAALAAAPAPPGYFEAIREICDTHHIVFIADEVMTGFGRTGKNFGIEHWNAIPDIIATAKGMSGGYFPLGAVIATDAIVATLRETGSNFVAGHTYVANPLGTAVGLAVLRYLKDHDLVENARTQGERLLAALRAVQLRHPIIGDVRGVGLMVGLEFVASSENRTPFRPEQQVASRIADTALDSGLITYPLQGSLDGSLGDMIKLSPPLCITSDEVDVIVSLLEDAISQVESAVMN
jgi:adenosylmethionine-8-amino-7-oxononanoate aminotransferase